jgi:P-type conjugative transfer protein TrbJ
MQHTIARVDKSTYRGRGGRQTIARAVLIALALAATPGATLHAQFGIPGLGSLVGGLLGKGPQVVVDPTAVAKLVTQLEQQIQQIQVARSQLQLNVDNMRKLASPPWRRINATMAQVDLLAQQGQALAYTLRNVDAQFRQTFPGWRVTATMAADMRTQSERTLATLLGALNAMNATAQQFPVAAANLEVMKTRMSAVTSAQQAAELNGAIGIQGAEELALLRQQLAAQQNAQLVAAAHQVNHELQGAAWQQAYMAPAQVRRQMPARRDISSWAF